MYRRSLCHVKKYLASEEPPESKTQKEQKNTLNDDTTHQDQFWWWRRENFEDQSAKENEAEVASESPVKTEQRPAGIRAPPAYLKDFVRE